MSFKGLADSRDVSPLQKTATPNPKTGAIAFFIGWKPADWDKRMFIKDKSMWHATCLLLRVAKRRVLVQVYSLFDRFHDRPAGMASLVNKDVDVPGLGYVHVVRSVDCLSAMCPRPQLLTMKVLGEVESGAVIEVVLDNPTAVEGFPSLAQTLGCRHLATLRESDCWRVYLRKGL